MAGLLRSSLNLLRPLNNLQVTQTASTHKYGIPKYRISLTEKYIFGGIMGSLMLFPMFWVMGNLKSYQARE